MLEFGEKLENIFSPIADGRGRGLLRSCKRNIPLRRSQSLDPLPVDDVVRRTKKRSDNNKIDIIPAKTRGRVSQLSRFVIYLSCIRAVMDGYLPYYSYESDSL